MGWQEDLKRIEGDIEGRRVISSRPTGGNDENIHVSPIDFYHYLQGKISKLEG